MSIIFKRTSVRKYTGEKVSDEQIELILKAGMAAPSGCNAQPWEFLVIQDKEILEGIAINHPNASMLPQAGLGIVVCGDVTKVPAKVPNVPFWIQDCAAVTQNIMLQATELGLGSVWIGVYPREDVFKPIKNMLNLPEKIMPFSIVAIGHPDGEVQPKDKFDKAKIHFEKW